MDAEPTAPRGLRRTIVFGAPLLYYVVGIVHPRGPVVGDATGLFLTVHLAQPFLIALLGLCLVLLVAGVESASATVARLLALPFVVAYSVYEAFAGIAMGELVTRANALPARDRQAAAALIDSTRHGPLSRPLYLVAAGLWIAAVAAVVVALRRHAAPTALALVFLGAAAFAISHARPWGPLGMAAFLAGVVWLEIPPGPASNALRRLAGRRRPTG